MRVEHIIKCEYDAAGRLAKEEDRVYSYISLDKIESVTKGGRIQMNGLPVENG